MHVWNMTGGVKNGYSSSSDGAIRKNQTKNNVKHWYRCTCLWLLEVSGFHGATQTHKKTCMRLHVSQWGWLQRISGSWWKIFCDAKPSSWYIPVKKRTELWHCSLVVVWRFDAARLLMGYEWQLVSWLSAQHSHDLPWACLHCTTHTVTWFLSHKEQMIQLYADMTAWILRKMILIFCLNLIFI